MSFFLADIKNILAKIGLCYYGICEKSIIGYMNLVKQITVPIYTLGLVRILVKVFHLKALASSIDGINKWS